MLPKILVILGPTASGKSDLAVKFAKQFDGEVVSADSRQVYCGLNIGTGKITKKEMQGVPHHLLDVASPRLRQPALRRRLRQGESDGGQAKAQFSVAQYQKLAEEAITDILKRGKLPIICGGTGFYIQAIVDGIILPEVLPNEKLRKDLQNKSLGELCVILKRLDPKRFKKIDQDNPARLIRAIEIASALGQVPNIKSKPKYQTLKIGLTMPATTLKQKVNKRILKWLKQGLVSEGKKLRKSGLSWKRFDELGLEYRYLGEYLRNKINRKKMVEKMRLETWHYAKRQLTWFKKDGRIKWFRPTETRKIGLIVKKFLS